MFASAWIALAPLPVNNELAANVDTPVPPSVTGTSVPPAR